MGAITEDRKLTSQEKDLLRAFRREMVEVTEPIWKEIEQLRKEQRERHEADMRELKEAYEGKLARQKQFMLRIAGSIQALFGKEENN